MWPAIFILLKDVVVPEIATYFRERALAKGADPSQLPTNAEVIDAFEQHWRASAAKGQAFLDATDPDKRPPAA